jgi:hypothetical protein
LEEHFLINQNFSVEYFPNTDVIQKLTKNWHTKLNTAHSCFLFFLFLYTSQGMTAVFRKWTKNILFYRFSLLFLVVIIWSSHSLFSGLYVHMCSICYCSLV